MLQDLRISYCGPGSGALCRRLLEELPDWFGIPETIDSCAETAEAVPAVVASLGGSDIGILTLVRRTTVAAEIQVMAVARAYHRQGVGRAMLARAERELEDEGIEFLQVKTLSDAAGYEPYTRTRAFYEACGFRALEELPDLWGPDNPAVQLVKRLG